ncbi:beta-ketoacyl-ACP synthase II [Nevskia sp.]|uniref:beta-ketoacyl-ACP synthase II n=1 Tax=Nevskia sp. TaxID=1929292 RepID=UPI0025EE7A96|nr:beta-ketoacyl-ACP synthase II [Nevskia sp.]HET7796823.1 beta-ketoacyl-ACP synthase II [Nevskia sp.]
MTQRRVVVTGLGIVSPVGSDLKTAWSNILSGYSGIKPITAYDCSTYPTRFAGLVEGFDAVSWMGPKEVRRNDPFIHYGVGAAKMAVIDSGIEITDANRERIAVTIGSGIGGIGTIEEQCMLLNGAGGVKKVSPFFVAGSIINMVSGAVSIDLGVNGPSFGLVSACTTAAHSIGMAQRMIAYGDADIAIAGGAEAGSAPAGVAGFCASRALSTRNDSPQTASRPWDRDRDGFVLGDGAGVLVLEEYEHAKRRGARIYAEIIGFGMTSDAFHITQPVPGAPQVARCMVNAMRDAKINPSDVDHVNAHATSTPLGDVAESDAIKSALGEHAKNVAISGTKSMTGHLLGAAGGIEAIFSVLAIRDNVAPPTINLENPDEGCDLDYTPGQPRQRKIDVVISNSFGFGGTNGTLVFRRI